MTDDEGVQVSSPSLACPAVNMHVIGLVGCSLGPEPHETHRLLCEQTGEVLGEWTDGDPVFREPAVADPSHKAEAHRAA